jgi:hypothetical protein
VSKPQDVVSVVGRVATTADGKTWRLQYGCPVGRWCYAVNDLTGGEYRLAHGEWWPPPMSGSRGFGQWCIVDEADDPAPGSRAAAMVTALRYARDHRSAVPRYAFDYDEWARLVDTAIGPRDPAAKVPDTFDLEAARLAIGEG